MKEHPIASMEVFPEDAIHSKLEEQETEAAHLSYQAELRFYSHIKNGDPEKLMEAMRRFLETGFGVGRMSSDSLRQTQYWAVSCVAISIRFAIQGGLDELTAYRFSDACVRAIDRAESSEDIFLFMLQKAVELAEKVKSARESPKHSPYVKSCIALINKNLHSRLTIAGLAEACGVSPDYLARCFYREVGVKLGAYIKKRKLDFAKTLLEDGMKSGEVSAALSFCSQSHFIACFKREYGVTPKQYIVSPGQSAEEIGEKRTC